jgi:hypothetical protein
LHDFAQHVRSEKGVISNGNKEKSSGQESPGQKKGEEEITSR